MCKTNQKKIFDLKPFQVRFFTQGFNSTNVSLKI